MARKLRLMLIDDNPVTELETEFLDLQPVAYGEEDEDPSLGTWTQHLRLWSENLFCEHNPDLVLIDCRFEEDCKYAPMSDALRGHDPRGLMHGAIFVARMFGRDRFHPFGFSVYSMDASGFSEDAYAQTFMGFLMAMRDSTLADGETGFLRGHRDRDFIGNCSKELASTVRQNPATAWGPALEMYRERFCEVAAVQAIVVEKESWLQFIDAVKQGRLDELNQGMELRWRRFDRTLEAVDVRSLFADQLQADKWTEETSSVARVWLEKLLVLGDYLKEALEWVKAILVDGQDPEELPVSRGRDLHGQRLTRFFHACTGVITWYENRSSDEPKLSSSALVLELGLSDKQLNRYFKPLVELPWGRVVDRLDEGLQSKRWPLPAQWELFSVLKAWAEEVRGSECSLRGPGEE